MRLLLPINDNERGSYGLKQALIAKTYVEALHLNKNSVDAETLLYWKDPSKIHSGSSAMKTARGDFCHILENILQSRVRMEYSSYTVKDVNDVLTDLSNCVNMASKVEIIRSKILNNYNAREQKWIMRILFQDLKIGIRHEQVFKMFYPYANQRYNECTVCIVQWMGGSVVYVYIYLGSAEGV